jgi:MtN3 and saliva related transmembrane protein
MHHIFTGIRLPNIVGIIAGVLTATSMLPQLIKTITKKQSEEIAVGMLLVLDGGIALWIWYGILKTDYPIIITNAFSLLVNILMLIPHFKYRTNRHTNDKSGSGHKSGSQVASEPVR